MASQPFITIKLRVETTEPPFDCDPEGEPGDTQGFERERLKDAQKLAQMERLNRTRMNYLEEFQKMIDEYNAGASNIETLLAKLMAFTERLSDEEKRGISERLTEEELVIFGLLTKPEVKLTKSEEAEVKKVAKTLLETLKNEKLVLDWKKRQTTRAAVRYAVETVLDQLPRAFTKELYAQKCDLVYEHVFDSYQGQGVSLYAN